jgi:glycerol uptake facilitator-like aquaporin
MFSRGWNAHLSTWGAEALGSAALVFAALSALSLSMRPDAPLAGWPLHVRLLVVGLAVGGTVALFALSPVGEHSGAHLNPAVTLFMTLRRLVTVPDLIGYVGSQLVGSVAGVLMARLVWGARLVGVEDGVIQPAPGWAVPAVAVSELLSTVVLLLGLAWLTARPRGALVPIANALLVAGLIVVTGAGGGGSFNPARNFGPQLVTGDYRYFWTYLLAPLLGAALAAAGLAIGRTRPPTTHKLCVNRTLVDR